MSVLSTAWTLWQEQTCSPKNHLYRRISQILNCLSLAAITKGHKLGVSTTDIYFLTVWKLEA